MQTPGACPPPGKCNNVMGSFMCSCPAGYELSAITGVCEDVDECLLNPGICENGICTNTDGSKFNDISLFLFDHILLFMKI